LDIVVADEHLFIRLGIRLVFVEVTGLEITAIVKPMQAWDSFDERRPGHSAT